MIVPQISAATGLSASSIHWERIRQATNRWSPRRSSQRPSARWNRAGYTYAATGADLLINFNAKLAQQTRVTQTPAPMPTYYGYRRGFYGGWGAYETQVDQYMEGTLNVDVVDATRKQLVWEGVAVGRVRDKAAEQRQAALTAAVAEIFGKYPFRAAN